MHVIMANNTAGGIILTKTDSKTVYAPDMPATCHSNNDNSNSNSNGNNNRVSWGGSRGAARVEP